MSSSKHRARRPVRRLIGIGAAVLGLAGLSAAAADTASAAGLLPTTTTLATSSPWVATGQPVGVTSTVKILGILPGLGITPTGTVTFSSPGAVSTTAPLGACLLTTCTAKGSITLPVAGDRVVTATYNGDLLTAKSSAARTVTVYASTSTDTETCTPSVFFCTSSTARGSDCDAESPQDCVTLVVTDVRSSTTRTVNAAIITGDQPTCADAPADPAVPWALFSSTSNDARKFVRMSFYGPQATALVPPLDGDGNPIYNWYGCYTSTKPFTGYIGGGNNHSAGTLGPAPLVGGFYQAKLPRCSGSPYLNGDSNQLDGLNAGSLVPCVSLSYSDDTFGTHFDISVVTAPGDPKIMPS